MDNQQETFRAYIAGLFEGEGSINIGKILIYGKQLSYRGQVQFTNTEPEIVQKFVDYLKLKGWHYHVRVDVRKNKHKVCYQVQITKKKDKIAFLDDMTPLFVGKKKQEAELVAELIKAIDSAQTELPTINTNGYYEKNPDRFALYEEIYHRYKAIKGSSETTCDAPIKIG